jgi:hypothetical protein
LPAVRELTASEIHIVDDAAQPRKLADALLEGARAAAAL